MLLSSTIQLGLNVIDSPSLFSVSVAGEFLPWILKLGTPAMRRFLVERVPSKGVQNVVYTADVMDQTSQEIYRSKKQALQDGDEAVHRQIGEGKDIMSVLRT